MSSEQTFIPTEKLTSSPEKLSSVPQLPIIGHIPELLELYRNNPTFILQGETGSGKSTAFPLALLESLQADPNQKILVTQPRRFAATSVANRVKDLAGKSLEHKIGYQVRFDSQTTQDTQLNFVTDGILLSMLQTDPLLQKYQTVMVDEAHERSINIDLVLGLLKHANQLRAESDMDPIKIIIASATIDADLFSNYFDQAPVTKVAGRMFPIQKYYLQETPRGYLDVAQKVVIDAVSENTEGDILIFLPGKNEIDTLLLALKKHPELAEFEILPLHAQLNSDEQSKVYKKGNRKIILSTNIAETSVTLPNVRVVIDSGLVKQNEFNPRTGVESLTTKNHSQAGIEQRAGRGGRVGPGKYYALYSEELERPAFTLPEIQRSNLAATVLTMKMRGITDVVDFDFIQPPPKESILAAEKLLRQLGALDAQNQITELGKQMHDIPVKPEIARMVIEAAKYGVLEQVASIAAFLDLKPLIRNSQDPRTREEIKYATKGFVSKESDFLTIHTILREFQTLAKQSKSNRDLVKPWARDHYIDIKVLEEGWKIRWDILKALEKFQIDTDVIPDDEELSIQKSIAAGLVHTLKLKAGRGNYYDLGNSSSPAKIHPGSGVFSYESPELVVASQIKETSATYMSNVQAVKPEWLPEIAPQSFVLTNQKIQRTYTGDIVSTSEIRHISTRAILNNTSEIVKDPIVLQTYWLQQMWNHLSFNKGVSDTRKSYEKFSNLSSFISLPSPETVLDILRQKLNPEQTTQAGINDSITESIDIKSLLSPEDQEKIQNSKLEINIGETVYPLRYNSERQYWSMAISPSNYLDTSLEQPHTIINNEVTPIGLAYEAPVNFQKQLDYAREKKQKDIIKTREFDISCIALDSVHTREDLLLLYPPITIQVPYTQETTETLFPFIKNFSDYSSLVTISYETAQESKIDITATYLSRVHAFNEKIQFKKLQEDKNLEATKVLIEYNDKALAVVDSIPERYREEYLKSTTYVQNLHAILKVPVPAMTMFNDTKTSEEMNLITAQVEARYHLIQEEINGIKPFIQRKENEELLESQKELLSSQEAKQDIYPVESPISASVSPINEELPLLAQDIQKPREVGTFGKFSFENGKWRSVQPDNGITYIYEIVDSNNIQIQPKTEYDFEVISSLPASKANQKVIGVRILTNSEITNSVPQESPKSKADGILSLDDLNDLLGNFGNKKR